MDQIRSDEPEGAPASALWAHAGAPSGGAGSERRNSARRKLAAVTRLLRGEPLETVARELNVTVARLSAWRDRALVGAEAAMKERERDSRDEELLRRGSKPGHTRSWVGAAGIGDGTFWLSPVGRVWTEVLAQRRGCCPGATARTWPSRRWPVRRRSATWPPGTG